jgi:aryl-alcohol dehydrogenase-like predicted oxidoreductase
MSRLVDPGPVDPPVPIEEVAGVIRDLIKEGKVLHFGSRGREPGTCQRSIDVR